MAAPHPPGQLHGAAQMPMPLGAAPPHPAPFFGGWAPPPVPPPAGAPPAWPGPHREGSWPWVLARVAPGTAPAATAAAAASDRSTDSSAQARRSRLARLALRSCGYARIACARVDQSAVEPAADPPRAPWFAKREAALAPAMMSSADGLLAEIVQCLPPAEASALVLGFGCALGWGDEVGEFEREGPTFDGCLEGGAGRFSGVLEAG